MARRSCSLLAVSLLAVPLVAVALSACAPGIRRGEAIEFRGAARCSWLQFRASVSPADPTLLHELVVAVNGDVCHREGVPGNATVHGELAALCPGAGVFEPGSNLVEVTLVPPGCGAPPVARRRILCLAPEPD